MIIIPFVGRLLLAIIRSTSSTGFVGCVEIAEHGPINLKNTVLRSISRPIVRTIAKPAIEDAFHVYNDNRSFRSRC